MIRAGLSLAFLALVMHSLPAHARQLDKDECAKLKSEQTQLEQAGVRGTMVKGAEWAKANLAPDKLEQIKRLIELDEQLLFRCGGRPLVVMPSEPDPDPAARGTDPEGQEVEPAALTPKPSAPAPPPAGKKAAPPAQKAAAPPAAAPPKEAPKAAVSTTRPAPPPIKGSENGAAAPKASKDAAKSALPAKTGQPEAAGSTPAAPAKAKKKIDDAYRPSSQDWSTDPFGTNTPPAAKN
ncbi:MAG TPA: hypothetical protein VJ740_16755 [Hyphomicrobiaceae bacterium]|nr:hypothetical protein [Hyphomicrobiaceae bacterium]